MNHPPDIHHRRNLRLPHYDYAQAGAYYVTICTHGRACWFGNVLDGAMHLNGMGMAVSEQWQAIPERFSQVELDAFVVMPNHIHMVFFIVGAPLAGAQSDNGQATKTRAAARAAPTTVGDIVGAYKSLCVQRVLDWIKQNDPGRVVGRLWQRNYYEHIIRDEASLARIREYIANNPMQWALDQENPVNARSQGK